MKLRIFSFTSTLAVANAFAPQIPKGAELASFSSSSLAKSSLCLSHPKNEISSKHNNDNTLIDRRSAIIGSISGTAAILTASTLGFPSTAEAAEIRTTWELDNKVQMPTLALNTVGLSADETEKAIGIATKEGIVHIDFHPGKERDGVAQYLAHDTKSREGLFLNTKIRKAPPGTSAKDAAELARKQIEDDLKILGLDSVDMLMLRDSPDCDVMQAQWAVLEDALSAGKTRSIGVINYCEKALTCLLETAKVKPALNYYMLHVGMGPTAHGLRTFCDSNGIRTFAYGAVGEPGPNDELLSSPILKKIGKAHGGKSPEEVALRWVLQTGAAVSVRPTLTFGLGTSACTDPSCAEGLAKRAQSFSWTLTDKEMKLLDSLTTPDDNPTLFSSAGCPNAFVMPK